MTFQAFVAAAEALCPQVVGSLTVRVEYCHYSHATLMRFSIWDGRLATHFYGDTAEDALESYRQAITSAPPVAEAVAALGEMAVGGAA